MSPGIQVPAPQLVYEEFTPGIAFLEMPLEVRNPAVSFPDGSPFNLQSLVNGKAGFFALRQQGVATGLELFDQGEMRWRTLSGLDLSKLKPADLVFKAGEALPWQGLLVAAGLKDADDHDVFTAQYGGYPRYAVQSYFAGEFKESPVDGLSPASPFFSFASVLDANTAGIETGDGSSLKEATRIRLFLRNSALQRIGSLEIYTSGGTAEIEIANFSATGTPIARVHLLDTGEIRLVPAAGQRVVVDGDLETERITYRPAGGGLKQTLP